MVENTYIKEKNKLLPWSEKYRPAGINNIIYQFFQNILYWLSKISRLSLNLNFLQNFIKFI